MYRSSLFAASALLLMAVASHRGHAAAESGTTASLTPPGTVVTHVPASTRSYIGSPGLARLKDGTYVASHDIFGPGSTRDTTRVFESRDRGATWARLCEIRGQWWSTLFVHRDALYLIGTTREYGDLAIRRSADGGRTWTTPSETTGGLLRTGEQYHCAPVPVVEWRGRLWRAVERRDPPTSWGLTFRTAVISAPADADLLDAGSWTESNYLPGNAAWLGGRFGGWLEGNVVVAPDDRLVNILRVHTPNLPEKAAIVSVSADGKTVSFNPATDFVDMPGGTKKLAIRRDEFTGLYWCMSNPVMPGDAGAGKPERTRNTLALLSSPDLRTWTRRRILVQHPDVKRHGFQYPDWLFEGDDIVALVRTAYDDADGGAHNCHDANYLTFHRFTGFRGE